MAGNRASPSPYRPLLIVLLVGAVLLASCAGGAATEAPSLGAEGVGEVASAGPPAATEAPTQAEEPPQVAATPTEEESSAPADEPQPVRTELRASDPEGVSLASGQVQFVEFFAFW